MIAARHELTIRRMLIGVSGAPASESVLARAAEIAAALNLEIAGRFAEEPAMRALASLPAVRMATMTGGLSRYGEAGALVKEIEIASRIMRRRLAAAAERAGVAWSFTRSLGALEDVLGEGATAADLLVCAEDSLLTGRPFCPPALKRLDAPAGRAAGLLYFPGRTPAIASAIASAEVVFSGQVEPELIGIAARLAGVCGGRLTISCPAAERPAVEALLKQLAPPPLKVDIVATGHPHRIAGHLRGSGSRLLILRRACLDILSAGAADLGRHGMREPMLVLADRIHADEMADKAGSG